MQRSNSENDEDIFFDASESSQRSSIDSPLNEESTETINPKIEPINFINEFSTMDLTSVHERRTKFFKGVGLDQFVQFEIRKDEISNFGDISETRNIISDSSPSCSDNNNNNGEINIENKGVFSVIKGSINEIGSKKLKSFQDFEILIGLSGLVKRFLQKDFFGKNKKNKGPIRKFQKFLRVFSKRKYKTMDISEFNHPKINIPIGVETIKHNKKGSEFSSLYMDQQIKAHKGPIRVMKFSPDGSYLATGGADSILRVWRIREIESSIEWEKSKGILGIIENVNGSGLALIPNKVFNILETPFHEFKGHVCEILDLTWSNSNYLLTSSMDKTVRLWKVGSENCLAIFQHTTFVTSVQFNPINEGVFMSGSIDGKVRFWNINENRVVDWVDSRHIITSVSFKPDAKGFAVGCFNGTTRLYELQDENIMFSHDLKFPSKHKSSTKRITSLQYTESGKLVITRAGSKIHITDGLNIIKKHKGVRRSKILSQPSFTSDGRYIISVCDQSRVHIFNSANFANLPSKKTPKSNKSCETFYSANASIAAPWPGFDFVRVKVKREVLNPLREVVNPLPDCLPCFFNVGPTLTWPEEKLNLKNLGMFVNNGNNQDWGAWNTVVVTAGSDGVIRSFPNYGFPVRL